jgi:membrane protease YdiL (CAAX protease family)
VSWWTDLRPALLAEKRALFLVVGVAVLLTLAWYPAHYTAFVGLAERLVPDPAYRPWFAHACQYAAGLVLLVLLPALAIRFVLRERLADFGLCIGDWRFGLAYVAVVSAVMAPLLWIGSADPELMAEYPLPRLAYGLTPWNPLLWELTYVVYYVGWEFAFRGVLQLGMEKRLGPVLAMLLQLLPSALIHMRKPFGEALSAVPGAFLMGVVAWRSRSILYAILLHWAIGAMTDLFCWLRLAGGA